MNIVYAIISCICKDDTCQKQDFISPDVPFESFQWILSRKKRVVGLSSSEGRIIVAWVILTQQKHVTDRQTGEQTDGFFYG